VSRRREIPVSVSVDRLIRPCWSPATSAAPRATSAAKVKCFEESPCELEGTPAPGFVKSDTSQNYCGANWSEATKCGTPCPDMVCPEGQECWGQVPCSASMSIANTDFNIDKANFDDSPEVFHGADNSPDVPPEVNEWYSTTFKTVWQEDWDNSSSVMRMISYITMGSITLLLCALTV